MRRRSSKKTRMSCPCGGGQSCIVDRRYMKAWVHEDEVLKEAGISLRLHCRAEPSEEQQSAWLAWYEAHNRPDSVIRIESET